MHYVEFKPRLELAEYVQLIWLMESESESENYPRQRIMPDGIVELIFHYREPFTTYRADDSRHRQSKSFAISQMREFIEIESNGPVGFISVRFLPWRLSLLPYADQDFSGWHIDAEQLWPDEVSTISGQIMDADNAERRKDIVEDFLLRQLQQHQRNDRRVDRAIKRVRQSRGQMTIARLCDEVQMTEKQLQRHFVASTGTTPKIFARVTRFLDLCGNLANYRNRTLTELSHDCGFYDQAHFIKEFKQFSGFTPKQFFEQSDIGFAEI